MCALVSPSGYYAWLGRWPSKRAREDVEISERIEAIHARSRGTYGAPRIHAELKADGIRVGRKRVARLMREAGLTGVSRRRKKKTTQRDPEAQAAPDLVEREFTSPAADRLWVADITYVPTGSGFLYLAVVVDAFSRKVVGWAMEAYLRTELVLKALNGDRATASAGSDPSLRSREPVHGRCVREAVPGGRDPSVDEIRGGLLRQRAV